MSDADDHFQAIAQQMDQFCRLEAGFAAKGWHLHRLHGDKVQVTSTVNMCCVLDLQAAEALLRQIGGAS